MWAGSFRSGRLFPHSIPIPISNSFGVLADGDQEAALAGVSGSLRTASPEYVECAVHASPLINSVEDSSITKGKGVVDDEALAVGDSSLPHVQPLVLSNKIGLQDTSSSRTVDSSTVTDHQVLLQSDVPVFGSLTAFHTQVEPVLHVDGKTDPLSESTGNEETLVHSTPDLLASLTEVSTDPITFAPADSNAR